jgi:hypothetical protein
MHSVPPQVANWGLPLAALSDMQRDESLISGVMSPTMAGYSCVLPSTHRPTSAHPRDRAS